MRELLLLLRPEKTNKFIVPVIAIFFPFSYYTQYNMHYLKWSHVTLPLPFDDKRIFYRCNCSLAFSIAIIIIISFFRVINCYQMSGNIVVMNYVMIQKLHPCVRWTSKYHIALRMLLNNVVSDILEDWFSKQVIFILPYVSTNIHIIMMIPYKGSCYCKKIA